MKIQRYICIFLLLLFPLLLTACKQTRLQTDESVKLTFACFGSDISVNLSPEESAKVVDILSGNEYAPLFSGSLSCGFSKDVSLKVGGRTFAIARDACSQVQDMRNLQYFSISDEDMDYIHKLFEAYGGYFPCI